MPSNRYYISSDCNTTHDVLRQELDFQVWTDQIRKTAIGPNVCIAIDKFHVRS